MALTVGEKLGPYEILAPIGAGGMGEVYRAKDSKLKREVALKVLPEVFARDPERMARFQREAEVLASLNHPNIAAIYGVEDRALVMELVEGEQLKGPLPLDTALNYARQIAEALEYAHERGVIHRDLKPANVKVTPQGVVKLLDFGLAKAIEPEVQAEVRTENSPTMTMGAMSGTAAGVILGTAAYMSPEQARGKPADKRSDIWAFGALLYELLTGNRAFHGETTTDILASVVKEEPSLDAIPPRVRPLIARCLRKDARQRWQAIGDVRVVLEEGLTETPALVAAPPVRAGAVGWILAALATVVAGVALWGWLRPQPAEPRIVTRFTVPLPPGNPFPIGVAMSRDGSRMAFSGGMPQRIYVRDMDQLEAKPIPGTEGGQLPQFSPDGQSLLFITSTQLKKIAIAGGPAQALAPSVANVLPTWGIDNNILYGTAAALMQIPTGGGAPVTLYVLDAKKGENQPTAPQLLPGGKAVLFFNFLGGNQAQPQTVVLDLQTKQTKVLPEISGIGWYISTGHIVYGSGGSLFAVPFDTDRLQVTGSPVQVLGGVLSLGPLSIFGISDSGTLAYAPGGSVISNSSLVWVDRHGSEQPLPDSPRIYGNPKISPTGDRIAVQVTDANLANVDLWIYQLPRGPLTRRTFGGQNFSGIWSADSKQLIHNSGRGQSALVATPADGGGTPVTLLAPNGGPSPNSSSASPDGTLIAGVRAGLAGSGNEAWVLPSGGTKLQPILDSQGTKTQLQFSPDGHWLAYQSDESGRNEIYVVPYPGPGGKSQASVEGGTVPRWSRDGRELFFKNGSKMMAVEVQTSPIFRVLGTPKMLFDYPANAGGAPYDVAKDGRFLMVKNNTVASAAQTGAILVIANWFNELRKRAPAGK